MKRIEKLKIGIEKDFYTKKDWNTLSKDDQNFVFRFIKENEDKDYNEFNAILIRMDLSTSPYKDQAINLSKVRNVLTHVAFTEVGFYGYEGPKRFNIHGDKND